MVRSSLKSGFPLPADVNRIGHRQQKINVQLCWLIGRRFGSRSIRPRTIRPLFFRSFSGSGMYLYSSFFLFHCFVLLQTLLATSTTLRVSINFYNLPRAKAVFLLLLHSVFKLICRHIYRTKHETATLHPSRCKGVKLPVVDGYVFVCNDMARKRCSCRTRSCRTTLTLNLDENGVYIEETLVNMHPSRNDNLVLETQKNERSGKESPEKPYDDTFNRNKSSRRKLGGAAAQHGLAFHSPFSPRKRMSKNGF